MKTKIMKLLVLTFLFTNCLGMLLLQSQTCLVTFQADFNDVIVDDPSTIGIRGSIEPLSWTNTMMMEDKDGDGIYSIKIEFEDIVPGQEVLYKYVYGDVIWENDMFGAIGNRTLYLYEGKNKLPVDKWDHLDKYSLTNLLEDETIKNFWDWIYIIGSEKQNCLSPEEIGLKITAFWGSMEWMDSPQIILGWERISQLKHSDGYFEIIENTTEKVTFKAKKTWLKFFGDQDEIMNVTPDDMSRVFKTNIEAMAMAKAWKCEWKDEEEFYIVSIEK